MIRIIAVGKVKEKYIKDGIDEYLKRIESFCKLETVELKDEGVEKEAKRLEKYITPDAFILDVGGKEISSNDFAKLIGDDKNLTFIIGGPEGISKSLKKNTISLSRMTFTHEMARLFLVEQIYRGLMINSKRSYHK